MPSGRGEGSKRTQFKPLSADFRSRFMESFIPEPNSGCWLWLASCDDKCYGRITINSKTYLAHRVSLALHSGVFPTKFVLHKCDNTYCVNPEHLYEGTQADNVRDCVARNRRLDQRGEKSHRAKLTNQQVLAIREDTRPQTKIAYAYGISQSQVSFIKLRKKWGHL